MQRYTKTRPMEVQNENKIVTFENDDEYHCDEP